MAHIHEVRDTNAHFIIDPLTRKLSTEDDSKLKIVQYDHNSERITFEIPRYIDAHDMATCNVVHVHYLNVSADGRTSAPGVYEIEDMHVSAEDEDIVVGTWLISRNATQLVGSLNFLIRFMCVNEGVDQYAWNTAIYTDLVVDTGLYNGELIFEDYADVLVAWSDRIAAVETRVNAAPLTVAVSGDPTGFRGSKTYEEVAAAYDKKEVVFAVYQKHLFVATSHDSEGVHFDDVYHTNCVSPMKLVVTPENKWSMSNGGFPASILPMDDIVAAVVSALTNVAEEGA